MTRRIGVVIFPGFETLDVYGPLGLLVMAPTPTPGDVSPYTAFLIGEPTSSPGDTILSSSNLPTIISHTLETAADESIDVLLIPGGLGNRRLLPDIRYIQALHYLSKSILERNGTIFCVCTGSILLAATGLLNGRQATTNKQAYDSLTKHYSKVFWKAEARWTIDGNIITSSGITAGMVLSVADGFDGRMLRWI